VPCINTIVNKVYIWYNFNIILYNEIFAVYIIVLICLIVCNYEFLEDAYVDQRIFENQGKKSFKSVILESFVVSLILGIAIGTEAAAVAGVLTI